jgi:uncharacterized protein (TIGR02594 family)
MLTDPKWLKYARSKIGEREIKGPRHNPWIVRGLAKLKAWWADDETPWCGFFVAHCMEEAGLPFAKHWYRAKGWADYGSRLRSDRIAPGAILVFDRVGGGHVGFYVGESIRHYYVLGGNQGNEVSIAPISKDRCVAIRWPKDEAVIGTMVYMAGGKVSTNEA